MYEFLKNHPQRRVFSNVNLSNLENLLYKEQTGPGSAFLELVEAHILKMFPLSINHGGIFHEFNVCISLPKKL